MYPARPVITMPGPRGRPFDKVRPDVSECRRMPDRRRPVSTAASAWPPSWAIVTKLRVNRQAGRITTQSRATTPVTRMTVRGGTGCAENSRPQRSARDEITAS